MEIDDKFLTREKFSYKVIVYAQESSCTLLESILDCASEYGLTEYDMTKYLSKELKDRLEVECIANGLVKGAT